MGRRVLPAAGAHNNTDLAGERQATGDPVSGQVFALERDFDLKHPDAILYDKMLLIRQALPVPAYTAVLELLSFAAVIESRLRRDAQHEIRRSRRIERKRQRVVL